MAKTLHSRRLLLLVFIIWLTLTVIIGITFICSEIGSSVANPVADYSELHQKTVSTFLVVLILSSLDEHVRRDTIRSTWLNYFSPEDVHAYFAIGTNGMTNRTLLDIETEKYRDILQLQGVTDSYGSLTDKVIASFIWLKESVDFSYVFKADSDTFARLSIIIRELRQRHQHPDTIPVIPLYWGFFDGRARVKKSGRWSEQRWTLCDRYLPHARGGGYILSSELVSYVARNAALLQRFNSEDVSLGAWLAPLNIERKHDPRFDTEHISRGCFESYVVTHKQSIDDMHTKYNSLRESGQLCAAGEFRTRKSYVYNWSVLPSLCCNRTDPNIP